MLSNGLSRYDQALTAAERASADPDELGLATWSLAELIEAAARTGALERASGALRRFSGSTSAAATDWALGIQARSTAPLSGDFRAERLYLEAIETAGPDPDPRGAGPRAPALRRVAAPPGPPP